MVLDILYKGVYLKQTFYNRKMTAMSC